VKFSDYSYILTLKQLVNGLDTGVRIPLISCDPSIYSPLTDPRLDIVFLSKAPLASKLEAPNWRTINFTGSKSFAGSDFDTKFHGAYFRDRETLPLKETLSLEKVNLVENVGSFDSILPNLLSFNTLGGFVACASLGLLCYQLPF
jgi:hypothetical protein